MSDLFNRVVSFDFGEPGQEGTRVEGLRIAFDIQKDDGSTSNLGKITVYGLSRDTIAEMQEDNKYILLNAGYKESGPGLIFAGDITKCHSYMNGADRITEIESGDGQRANSEARLSKSYPPGQSSSQIMGDLAGTMAEFLGQDKEDVSRRVAAQAAGAIPDSLNEFPRGKVVGGRASDSLTSVSNANQVDWMISDGEIQIVAKDQPLPEEAYLVNPDSGLIGSPEWTDEGRLEVKMLLRGDIRPRSVLKIESREFTGFVMVRSVHHKGDSGWSSDYYTEIEATSL